MLAKPRMRLVPDWKRAARWWSVRLSLLNAAGLQAWLVMPDDLKAHLPPTLMAWLASGIAMLAVIARVIAQELPPT